MNEAVKKAPEFLTFESFRQQIRKRMGETTFQRVLKQGDATVARKPSQNIDAAAARLDAQIKEKESHIPSSAKNVLPSYHLGVRCAERDISQVELDAAIRHGERTEGEVCKLNGLPRWLLSYNGITYVTDFFMRQGITSWVDPCWGFDLEKVPISQEMDDDHSRARTRAYNHSNWNSHAVIVVDQSGSMRTTDATKGITRSDLVWLCLAVDYVGKRLRSGEATSKDYVSIVELGGTYDCIVKEHPLDWILYNRIIDLLRGRCPRGEGKYLPAIDKAHELLSTNKSGKCALQLVFLTDGIPSDRGSQEQCQYVACNSIAALASRFGSRLTVGGFAVGVGQYPTLKAMVETAKEYNCRGFLMEASLRVEDLSSAFTSMSTLMTETKTTMTDFKTNAQRTYRDLVREPTRSVDIYNSEELEWKMYTNQQGYHRVVRTVFDRNQYDWIYPNRTFESYGTVGIAVRDLIFGEGRERAVRRVREIDSRGQFVGPPLVGKETLFREDLDPSDIRAFHKNFCKMQQLAQKYAAFFNRKLQSLPGVNPDKVPLIQFLDCWVMMFTNEKNRRDAVLVEKMLDYKRYTKWNTNAGYVKDSSGTNVLKPIHIGDGVRISVEDIPQAYSHFTYWASGRRFLVCDLQGVLNTTSVPPVFELTDPAIHYKKLTDRTDFGRTDRGEDGIQAFFRTHKCSALCRMVGRRWIKDDAKDALICRDILNAPADKKASSGSSDGRTKRVRFAL